MAKPTKRYGSKQMPPWMNVIPCQAMANVYSSPEDNLAASRQEEQIILVAKRTRCTNLIRRDVAMTEGVQVSHINLTWLLHNLQFLTSPDMP